jgi:hypothetical protein
MPGTNSSERPQFIVKSLLAGLRLQRVVIDEYLGLALTQPAILHAPGFRQLMADRVVVTRVGIRDRASTVSAG